MGLKDNLKTYVEKRFDISIKSDILDFCYKILSRLCKRQAEMSAYVFSHTSVESLVFRHCVVALDMVIPRDLIGPVRTYVMDYAHEHIPRWSSMNFKKDKSNETGFYLDYKLFYPMISKALRAAVPDRHIEFSMEVAVLLECMMRNLVTQLIDICISNKSKDFTLSDLKDVITSDESFRNIFYRDVYGHVPPLTIERTYLNKCIISNKELDCKFKRMYSPFKMKGGANVRLNEYAVAFLDRVIRSILMYNMDKEVITLDDSIDALHKQNIWIEYIIHHSTVREYLESCREFQNHCMVYEDIIKKINRIVKRYSKATFDDELMWLVYNMYESYTEQLIDAIGDFVFICDQFAMEKGYAKKTKYASCDQIDMIGRYFRGGFGEDSIYGSASGSGSGKASGSGSGSKSGKSSGNDSGSKSGRASGSKSGKSSDSKKTS